MNRRLDGMPCYARRDAGINVLFGLVHLNNYSLQMKIEGYYAAAITCDTSERRYRFWSGEYWHPCMTITAWRVVALTVLGFVSLL